jgi:hypothetical protein
MMTYQILDPVVEPSERAARLAPRLASLEGARIGLWSNRKINTKELLDEVEVVLRQHYKIGSTARGFYNGAAVMRPEEWGDIDGCDAVILTHGD